MTENDKSAASPRPEGSVAGLRPAERRGLGYDSCEAGVRMHRPPGQQAQLARGQSPIQIVNTDIYTTAVKKGQYPETGWPEVAFVGKSNVGKSSLINAMLGRKRLARTSGTPGKTRTINFFHVENKLLFADLPGYGYARISKSESEKWGEMVEEYLKDRPELKRIFLLIDIRHAPGENDLMLFEWLQHFNLPFTLVATKSDKLKRSQIPRHLAIIRKTLGVAEPPIPFSSETKDGRNQLWSLILDSCGLDVL